MPEPEAGAATAVATAEATEQIPASTAEASATPATDSAAESVAADPYALIADLDPDELVKRFPKLQTRIGHLAQKQAQQQAQAQMEAFRADQQRLAEVQRQQEQLAEMEALARQDPEAPLSQKVLSDTLKQRSQAQKLEEWKALREDMARGVQKQIEAVYEKPEVKALWDAADEATRKRMDYRTYADFSDFVMGVSDVLGEARVNARADELAKARIKAMEATNKIAAATNGAERPDLGLGDGAPGARRFSRSDIASMSLAEFKKNESEIDRQAREGQIIDDVSR